VLTIEQYISRRKSEDRLNEFDINARNDNMRVCVNYIFEYYNNYLNITDAEERTAIKDEKLDKYRHELRAYDKEVIEWLVGMFSEHEKRMHTQIGYIIKQYDFFFLYSSESEFRSLFYDCYAKLIKKFPFLKDRTEMLFLFIKEYHRIKSQPTWGRDEILIHEEISDWVKDTWVKHRVNLLKFVSDYINYFSDYDSIWPTTHKLKSKYYPESPKYDYDYKQMRNLFNLDSLYRQMPKKAFIKGKKQEFEILMMDYWLYSIEGDKEYWQVYWDITLPSLKKA
jgi:hypothetical protein